MSAVDRCVSEIERLLGPLSPNEKLLAELLCTQGAEPTDIVAGIRLLRWLPIKRQIEEHLGRKLTPEEAVIARRMHRKGATIEEICKTLDPSFRPGAPKATKPKF